MALTKICTCVPLTLNVHTPCEYLLLGFVAVSDPESLVACRCLLVAVLTASAVFPGNAQAPIPRLSRPSAPITNYRQYLQYAGQAMGYLPVQPEADTPLSVQAPAEGPSGSSMAPMTAPAGDATDPFQWQHMQWALGICSSCSWAITEGYKMDVLRG